jgi:hypothetical protein
VNTGLGAVTSARWKNLLVRSVLACMVMATVFVAACGTNSAEQTTVRSTATSVSSTSLTHDGTLSPSELRRIARRAAHLNGESHPTNIEWVTSDLDTAEEFMSGDTGDFGSDKVFLIQVQGTFICNTCSRPDNASAPTGKALGMIVDARSGTGRADAVMHSPLDLSTLGTVER